MERARVTDVMEGWGQPGGSQEFERGLRKVAQRGGESFVPFSLHPSFHRDQRVVLSQTYDLLKDRRPGIH